MSQIPADGSQIPANGTRVRQGKRHGKIDSTGHYPPWGLRIRVDVERRFARRFIDRCGWERQDLLRQIVGRIRRAHAVWRPSDLR